MASTMYETILREARQLPIHEQRQLRAELDVSLAKAEEIEASEQRQAPHVRHGLRADLEALDALAAQIGAAWKSGRSAVEAVNDQRR